MKTKSRDHRKLVRAQKRFNNALKNQIGYGEGLLLIQLHMMSVARWYFSKYPKSLPKIKFTYKK